MIEAQIKKIKQCYIYPYTYSGLDDFIEQTKSAKNNFNTEMPLDAINGRTPDEAYNGIDTFTKKLKMVMEKSYKQRVDDNKNGNCW